MGSLDVYNAIVNGLTAVGTVGATGFAAWTAVKAEKRATAADAKAESIQKLAASTYAKGALSEYLHHQSIVDQTVEDLAAARASGQSQAQIRAIESGLASAESNRDGSKRKALELGVPEADLPA